MSAVIWRSPLMFLFFVFFFQAEDGIRDWSVTGVQTCALPISGFLLGLSVGSPAEAERGRAWPADYWSVGPCFATANKPDAGAPLGAAGFRRLEIGRASCRERV